MRADTRFLERTIVIGREKCVREVVVGFFVFKLSNEIVNVSLENKSSNPIKRVYLCFQVRTLVSELGSCIHVVQFLCQGMYSEKAKPNLNSHSLNKQTIEYFFEPFVNVKFVKQSLKTNCAGLKKFTLVIKYFKLTLLVTFFGTNMKSPRLAYCIDFFLMTASSDSSRKSSSL